MVGVDAFARESVVIWTHRSIMDDRPQSEITFSRRDDWKAGRGDAGTRGGAVEPGDAVKA